MTDEVDQFVVVAGSGITSFEETVETEADTTSFGDVAGDMACFAELVGDGMTMESVDATGHSPVAPGSMILPSPQGIFSPSG